jgi:signal transduction histidine kinase
LSTAYFEPVGAVGSGPATERATALFHERLDANYRRTSHVFTVLMVVQWVFGIAIALIWSPHAWAGRTYTIHLHIYTAVVIGGALSSLPVLLTIARPTAASTRYVVAIAQVLWSGLLIHLSGGRIETHFHIFASLAFLSFYRDWRVFIPATLVVAGDHLLRGLWWPESVYGVMNAEWWRFLEHAFWVVCEDAVLVLACIRGVSETRSLAESQAEVELTLGRVTQLNVELDERVDTRTRELFAANGQLNENLERLNGMQQQLVEASRRAGMADVATAVLHNVGNVLNSVNVSSGVIADTLRSSKAGGLSKLGALLAQPDFEALLGGHPKGQSITVYVSRLAEALADERRTLVKEAEGLKGSIDHIKAIVSSQQAHAKNIVGKLEVLSLQNLVEEAVKVVGLSKSGLGITVAYEIAELPGTSVDRHKVFQIVLNFLNNARHAIQDAGPGLGRVTIRLKEEAEGGIRLEVEDNGCGIPAENLKKMFSHGFTTRKGGHGFGLHSSACMALEMGGRVSCRSEGVGRGSTFVLSLPATATRMAA